MPKAMKMASVATSIWPNLSSPPCALAGSTESSSSRSSGKQRALDDIVPARFPHDDFRAVPDLRVTAYLHTWYIS